MSANLPDNAPFSPAQRAWLGGFMAGVLSARQQTGASNLPPSMSAAEAAPAVEEEFPWHDAAMSMQERLKLAEDKPPARKMMAAMAQLDCGACGYLCKTYGEAVASGEEKDLTRCTPGGRDTARMLKQLCASAPAPAPAKEKIIPISAVRVKRNGTAAKTESRA